MMNPLKSYISMKLQWKNKCSILYYRSTKWLLKQIRFRLETLFSFVIGSAQSRSQLGWNMLRWWLYLYQCPCLIFPTKQYYIYLIQYFFTMLKRRILILVNTIQFVSYLVCLFHDMKSISVLITQGKIAWNIEKHPKSKICCVLPIIIMQTMDETSIIVSLCSMTLSELLFSYSESWIWDVLL